jgi:hypothetical protein
MDNVRNCDSYIQGLSQSSLGTADYALVTSSYPRWFNSSCCASVLMKYFVLVFCTSGPRCGDWGIMSIIYRILHNRFGLEIR